MSVGIVWIQGRRPTHKAQGKISATNASDSTVPAAR